MKNYKIKQKIGTDLNLGLFFFVRVFEKKVKKEEDPQKKAVYVDLEEKMKAALGTKVSINRKNDQKGKIEIEYYSIEELERLMEILMR